MGKMDEFNENKREIENGIIVKCEVIKNLEHYVRVRIIGSSEMGSIHVNELKKTYSADKRPNIGNVFEAKVLMKKFDNAKHCDIWQLTMNTDNAIQDIIEETAVGRALRLSGIKNH